MSNQKYDTIKARFRERRMPLSADYRPLFKIGLVLLVLKIASGGGKASLNKLHFLMYALKSSWNRNFIRNMVESTDTANIVSWGAEPALNKALIYAIAEGLVDLKDDKYILTKEGDSFVKMLLKEPELFTEEKEFLSFIGKRNVTERFINELTNKLTH